MREDRLIDSKFLNHQFLILNTKCAVFTSLYVTPQQNFLKNLPDLFGLQNKPNLKIDYFLLAIANFTSKRGGFILHPVDFSCNLKF